MSIISMPSIFHFYPVYREVQYILILISIHTYVNYYYNFDATSISQKHINTFTLLKVFNISILTS